MLNILLLLLLILILQVDPSRSFQVLLLLSKNTPSIAKSKNTLYSSPAKKGFGSTSSVTTVITDDDAKRKGTLEKLEQWAQSVRIA